MRSAQTGISQYVPMARSFTYDQLKRLKEATAFDNYDPLANKWLGSGAAGKHKEEFMYDANGNITELDRWGETQKMDQFQYNYANGANPLPASSGIKKLL